MHRAISAAFVFFLPVWVIAQGSRFRVQNHSGILRKSEAVVVSRMILKDLISIPEKKVAALYIKDQLVPSQMDDLNGDGQWDELAFQVDMERNSELEVRVKWFSPEDAPVFPSRVHAALWKKEGKNGTFRMVQNELLPEMDGKEPVGESPYRFGGPVWESEHVAFRSIIGSGFFTLPLAKSGHRLLKDTIRLDADSPGRVSGVLPLDSGLGLGGFAVLSNGIFRRAEKNGASFYRQIANGPLRAVFDVIYEDWQVDDQIINVRQRISIWAGQQGFKTELSFTGFEQPAEVLINFPVLPQIAAPEFYSINKAFSSMFWHGNLNDDIKNRFGAGLLFPRNLMAGVLSDQQKAALPGKKGKNAGMLFKLTSGQILEYFIFTGWEKENEFFGNSVQFKNTISDFGYSLETPLKIVR